MKTKTLPAKDCDKFNLSLYPNFSKNGSIKGMKALYYGKNAMLVKCGNYIYNVPASVYNSIP